jgi:homogentisate 1,2-dioxygenase
VIFIHEGTGTLKTGFGKIPFKYGDYLVIPRGTIYQMEFNDEKTGYSLSRVLVQYARLSVTEMPSDSWKNTLHFAKRHQTSARP